MGHSDSKDYTHSKPMGFKLEGETHTGDVWLKDWNHLLLVFVEVLYRRDKESFRSLLELKTSAGNPVLTRDPEKHFENRDWVWTEPGSKNRVVKPVDDSGIYLWTNYSANETVKLCKRILRKVGIPQDAFEVMLMGAMPERQGHFWPETADQIGQVPTPPRHHRLQKRLNQVPNTGWG